jgi:hypothetical protein
MEAQERIIDLFLYGYTAIKIVEVTGYNYKIVYSTIENYIENFYPEYTR